MSRSQPSAVVLALLSDAVLVVAFAAIGRASHGSEPFGTGLVETAWPFLGGLAFGWLVTLGWRRPLAPVPTGLGVWALTVAGGMLLRTMTGQGTELAFVIVAALTLLLFLVGWRLVASAVGRAKRRGSDPGE